MGGPDVEAKIAGAVEEAASIMRKSVPARTVRSIVLFGGYGRGEGGVEVRDDKERPHNNLDFLVVTRGSRTRGHAVLKGRLDSALEPVAERLGIGMDVGIIAERSLRHAPCRVMWYDMRFGHKTVFGDEEFVESLDRFRVDRIMPSDMRDLAVNRGTLLVINDEILARGALSPYARRTVIKHAVKAIIGYGDALLFTLGDYHWSYVERQKLMRESFDVPRGFRAMYDEAMEFRFRPDYSTWEGRNLHGWSEELRGVAEKAHLDAESRRLGLADLDWEGYPAATLSAGIRDVGASITGLAHGFVSLRRSSACPLEGTFTTRLGWRLASPRDRMGIAFPAVAFRPKGSGAREQACRILGAAGPDDAGLRRAFLSAWGRHGDPNFSAVANRLGISLAHGEAG